MTGGPHKLTFEVDVPEGIDAHVLHMRCREAISAVVHSMVGHRVPRASGLGYVRGDRERHERMHHLLAEGFASSLAAAAWEVAADGHRRRTRLAVAKRLVRSFPRPVGEEGDVAGDLAELARVRRGARDRRAAAMRLGKERLFAFANEAAKLERYIHDRQDERGDRAAD